MQLLAHDSLTRIRNGFTLGFGVHHLRGAAATMLAKACGYDWLFIDSEHGALSTEDIGQLCLSSLTAGIAPIVRVCRNALDEGTRALDAGALGIVVPHIDTADDAREMVEAFRFPPIGRRSTGGPCAPFGFQPPPPGEMQRRLNDELLLIPMIETPTAVESAEAIAAIPGIDALLIGPLTSRSTWAFRASRATIAFRRPIAVSRMLAASTIKFWRWVESTTIPGHPTTSPWARAWCSRVAITASCSTPQHSARRCCRRPRRRQVGEAVRM
jgi:hypothetical protein